MSFATRLPVAGQHSESYSVMSRPNKRPWPTFQNEAPGVVVLSISREPFLQKKKQRAAYFSKVISGSKGIKKIKGPGVMWFLEFTPR